MLDAQTLADREQGIHEKYCGKMPADYRVVWFDGDEHYHYICGEFMSEGYCDRFDARRAAIADAVEGRQAA